MSILTFETTSPQSEAFILVEALTAWIKEQEQQPVRYGRGRFEYDAHGNLKSVTVTLDEV